MAWSNLPVAFLTTDIQAYSFYLQFWRACRERAWPLGAEFFPRTTLIEDTEAASSYCKYAPGYTGIIDSIALSGGNWVITDGSKSWPTNRYYDFVDSGVPFAPRFYDAVIEYDELNPWGVFRAKILANTATTLTLEPGPIDDANWAKQLPSVSSLAGKRYCIVRQNKTSHRSLHWHDRWPDWPNAQEAAIGIVGLPTVTTITDAQHHWGDGELVGKEMMTLVGGRLKRFAITGNTKDTITFSNPAGVAPDAGADYAVIVANAKWNYGRHRPAPWWWYRGADRPMTGIEVDPRFYSHWSDGTIQPTPVAALLIKVMRLNDDGTVCEPTDIGAFDMDVWSEPDDICDAPDRPYAPDLFKAWRALQGWVEGIAPEFIEAKSYDNLSAIPEFTTATWFKAAGVNAFTTTVSSASPTHITFPTQVFPPEAIGALVQYTVLDDNGVPFLFGFTYAPSTVGGAFGALAGLLVSNTRIDLRGPTTGEALAFDYPPDQPYLDTWVGKTLVISLGWSRFFPREFRYLYPKTVFVAPDNDPPTEAHPGFYVTRAASTRYVQADELGRALDSDTPVFVTNEVARYVGDNWHDPTTGDSVNDGMDPDTAYRDKLFTGVAPPEFGTAILGTARSLRDDKKDWWTYSGVSDPPDRIVSTATGGSTLGLTDSAVTFDGIVGFIVEVEIAGISYARTIATLSAHSLTWATALPASASGANYRIHQPAAGAGVLRTDTGTGGGGSGTTGITDASKATSAFWDGTTGRWVGFVVEVDIGGTWFRRPITAYNSTTHALTWEEALPATANGRPYRIREPKWELNRWKGRTLLIYLPGATVSRPITHSDDDTVYFASIASELALAGLTEIPAGTSYHILERQPGEVLQWSGTSEGWVIPIDDDERGDDPLPWHNNPTENAPTVVRGFGRMRKGDYVTRDLLNQLYNGINALVWTKQIGFWDPQATPGAGTLNWRSDSPHEYGAPHDPPQIDYTVASAEADNDSSFPTSGKSQVSVDVPRQRKYIIVATDSAGDFASAETGITSVQMHAVMSLVKTVRIQHQADAYIYTGMNPADDDPVTTTLSSDGTLFGNPGTYLFDAQGWNVYFRKWGKIASGPLSAAAGERIQVGDVDDLPPHWPADPTPGPSSVAEATLGWSAIGDPIIILRWDVTGGMSYVAP